MIESSFDALYPLVQALGWALIHFCWQGALIAAVFAAGNLVLGLARPTTRYAFGLISMAMLAAAPIMTFWLQLPSSAAAPVESGAIAMLSTAVNAGSAQVNEMLASLERVLPWVVMFWALGVMVMSGRVFVDWKRMKRLTRVGVLPLSSRLQNDVSRLSLMFGIRHAVTVLESTIVKAPTVLGWLKPVILLPSSTLLGLSPGQLELIIAHELGHIRRLDYLVNLVQISIETALFYHPAVGWISRHVRDEREKCVDDLVVAHCGNSIQYAKALADLESMRAAYSMAPAIGATDGQLLQRIERIVCQHTVRSRAAIAGNSILLLLLAAVVLVAGRMGDPMAELEGVDRSRLADTLIAELLMGPAMQRSNRVLAPLDNARLVAEAIVAPERQKLLIGKQSFVESQLAITNEIEVLKQRSEPIELPRQSFNVEVAETVEAAVPPQAAEFKAQLPLIAEQSVDHSNVDVQPVLVETLLRSTPTVQRSTQPHALTQVSPDYPVRARMARQEGYAIVEFSIKGNGRVTEVRVVDSNPKRVFDKEARDTIRRWRFDPDTRARFGAKRFTQRFDFNLSAQQPLASRVAKGCNPVVGTRICRSNSPSSLVSQRSWSG